MVPIDAAEAGSTSDDMGLSVFEPIIERLRRSGAAKIIPLHQGKTVFTTPVELREWGRDEFEYPAYHDGPTAGVAQLLRAVQEKLESQHGAPVDPARIQITCGITHALSVVFHCILQPLDEVLILSPQWLFIKGLVRAARGIPIEVPFFHTSSADGTTARVRDVVAPRVTPRTRAIYFNSPNNPTGAALTPEQREDLLKVAEDHSLWVISDNAYEYYDFSPSGFVDQAFGDAGGSRTFSAYSLSKSYGLTGYRIGYLVSPTEIAERVRQFALYSIYSVPTCCQFAALSALAHGGAAIERHRRFIREAIAITTGELRVPATLPDGGFYTLLDLSRWPASVDDFIGRCIAEGVSLAPGSAFGDRCSGHARLCFSVVDHEDLAQGIHVINRVYESRARG